MTTPSWLKGEPESARLRAALLPLGAVSYGYRAAAGLHRGIYRHGWLRARRLPCCVISVGSLLVGGSGKTPLAAWVARGIRARGFRTAVASRGYGRSGREEITVVSDGARLRTLGPRAGDEPLLLASQLPGVPVLVGRDRGLVGLHAISAFATEVLVLDDGFQHHRLHRDVDLLAFDASLGMANGRALPRGPLRESPSALARADAICVVDGVLASDDAQLVERWAPDVLRMRATRKPTELRPISGGRAREPRDLAGLRVGMLAGIGNPASFGRTLEGLGAEVVAKRLFRDHARYRAADFRGMKAEAQTWVTTEKDALKILPSWTENIDLRVLRIELELQDEARALAWLEERVRGRLSELREGGSR